MFLLRALIQSLPIGNSRPRVLKSTVTRTFALAFLASALLLVTSAAHAATINYGNFNVPPAGIMFNNVMESSGTDPVPLFGPPAPFVTGLDFPPTTFVSTASGGASDITDGQLNFTIMGIVNQGGFVGINTINLFEGGDFTLAGSGTNVTQSLAGAIMRVTVTQINGVPVAPIVLSPSNASVGFNLASNPGIVQPWSLGLGLNVAGQLAPGQIATKVDVSIDNSLLTFSQPGSLAFIAKKEFLINLTSTTSGNPFIPEPTTMTLSLLAGVALVGLRRR